MGGAVALMLFHGTVTEKPQKQTNKNDFSFRFVFWSKVN